MIGDGHFTIGGKDIPHYLVAMVYDRADEMARKCAVAELAMRHNDEFKAMHYKHLKVFIALELQRIGIILQSE